MDALRIFATYNRIILCGGALFGSLFFLYAMYFGHLQTNFWAFRCDARGYQQDSFLSYCFDPAYGNYEHAAIFFATEPGLDENLKASRVIFVGNSRMKRAFSTQATAGFFSGWNVPFFNLAFGYGEEDVFFRRLIEFRDLKPAVVVVNADGFFTGSASRIAKKVLARADAEQTAGLGTKLKRWIQPIHARVCRDDNSMIRKLVCGRKETQFRSVLDGRTTYFNVKEARIPVGYTTEFSQTTFESRLVNARIFKQMLLQRKSCLVLTVVPHSATAPETARRLAKTLGVPFIMPIVEGLIGYDGNHLNQASAERWSTAFLTEFIPVMSRCNVTGARSP